jgi:hypothetical protein
MTRVVTAQPSAKALTGEICISRTPAILDLRKSLVFSRSEAVKGPIPLITPESGPYRIISQGAFPPLVLLQRGRRASDVWSEEKIFQSFKLMHNGNPANHLYHGYFNKEGKWENVWARNSKSVTFAQKAKEAIATICGERIEGKEVMIGFGPFHTQTKLSHWAAIDFDGKKGACPIQAERAALASLNYTIRDYPDLYYVLETSGSGGWHLYLFSGEMLHATEWTSILEDVVGKVASLLGKELTAFLQKGICEIFPAKDTHRRACGNAIRAIGTFNGSQKTFSEIVCENLSSLLETLGPLTASEEQEDRTKTKEEPFLVGHRGLVGGEWNEDGIRKLEETFKFDLSQCEIRIGNRHKPLMELLSQTFSKLGREVIKGLAHYFFEKSGGTEECPDLKTHNAEFDGCWNWMEEEFLQGLDKREQQVYVALPSQDLKDAFRIVRNFALAAQMTKRFGELRFQVSVGSLALRLGFSSKDGGSRIRKLLIPAVIKQVEHAIKGKRAALFRYVLRDPATFVELARYADGQGKISTPLEPSRRREEAPAVSDGETAMSPEEIRRIANELARMRKAGALEGLGKDEIRNIATTIHLFGATYEET